LVDTLLYNISKQDQTYIRRRLQNYYSGLGQNVEIPDFESYIAMFQAAHQELVTEYIYPDQASPLSPNDGPGGEVPNLLVKEATQFEGIPSVLAAIVPLGKSLKIKVTGDVLPGVENNGWVVTNNTDGFTIEAQRQNVLVAILVYLSDNSKDGSATIEYYEDSDTPTFTKQITWTGGEPHYE